MAGLALLFMSTSDSISQPAQAVSRIIQDSTDAAGSLTNSAKSAAVSLSSPAIVLPGTPFNVTQLSPFQESKLRQQLFCEDAASLVMPDTRYVQTQGVDMFVYR